MISNKSTGNPIREMNISSTLAYILNHGAVSRAQISSSLHINKPSVSEIVKSLIDKGILEEIGMGSSSLHGGRKPILVRIKEDWATFLCIDIGYNYLKYYLTYANGKTILFEAKENYMIDRNTIITEFTEKIHQLNEQSSASKAGMAMITLSIHGSVSDDRIIFTPYYDLVGLPIKETLEATFGIPVCYANEANLSCIANQALHEDPKNMISISIHSGVGAGMIMDGQPYLGSKHFSGEIGHTILVPGGNACPCGNQGCLETYCSEKAILEDFHQRFHKQLTLRDVRSLYNKGDAYTLEKVKQIARYLAIGINNLLVSFDPQIIYFNCALFQMFPEFIDDIKKNLHCFIVENIVLKISPIAEQSILIGGILFGMKKVYQVHNIQLVHMKFK